MLYTTTATTKSDINDSPKSVKYIQVFRSRIQNNIRKSRFSKSPMFISFIRTNIQHTVRYQNNKEARSRNPVDIQ